jgi:CsoR family transcriptional regulator, copper-sensing transcriptional repressor
MINAETKQQALGRLRRIAGQIQGIQRMVEVEKDCVDILLQISAVQGALEQVSKILMTRHIERCVQDSLRAGSERERSQKIDELVKVFTRHSGLAGR